MFFKCFTSGMYAANCYLLADNGKAIVIDAGVDIDEFMEVVNENKLKVELIVLTHAHIDHMTEVDIMREKTGAKAAVHEFDIRGFSDVYHNGSINHGGERTFNPPDIILKDGDVFEVGGMRFEVIHTPGHTAGCICLKSGNMLFTGDTIFKMDVGRTENIPYSCRPQMIDSIKKFLFVLDEGLDVYTGHAEPTTIGFEKKNNPL